MDENLHAEIERNSEMNTACEHAKAVVIEMLDDLGYDAREFKITVRIEVIDDKEAVWQN